MFETYDTTSDRQDQFSKRNALKAYAVLVHGPSIRTRVYTTLAGAERAVARARARGEWVEMCLVRLVPARGRLSWIS
ncbi:hypothetical protein GCM10023258_18180 [Terrabacter aeriphilus]|uniref:Uncharacterized protein n=1 Tax=Terrabacter aeriphilus TaxID=515662 RepID=A0ABP9JBQ2_9MICO